MMRPWVSDSLVWTLSTAWARTAAWPSRDLTVFSSLAIRPIRARTRASVELSFPWVSAWTGPTARRPTRAAAERATRRRALPPGRALQTGRCWPDRRIPLSTRVRKRQATSRDPIGDDPASRLQRATDPRALSFLADGCRSPRLATSARRVDQLLQRGARDGRAGPSVRKSAAGKDTLGPA